MRPLKKILARWRERTDLPPETAREVRILAAEVEGEVNATEKRWRLKREAAKARIDALMCRCAVAEDWRETARDQPTDEDRS